MGKIGKSLANFLRTTAVVSILGTPLFFTGCKKPDNPTPKVQSLEQSVALSNDVEIKYSATLTNVEKAKLNVKKEGVLISTEEISDVTSSGPDYQKTYSYNTDPQITKGNYEFDLVSENSSDNLEKKTDITIPNYPSSVSYNSIDLNENSKTSVTLNASDENPEDNPVSVVYVKPLDTKTQTTLNGNNLNITALPNQTGAYQLEVELKSALGELEKTVLNGNILKGKIKVNFFDRPNPGKNYYGSADVNNDNTVNAQDLTMLNEIVAGTYSNPSDTRLMDRADVNGDGVVNSDDAKILEDKLNGVIPYLPGEWNLLTPEQRFDWVLKMYAIDKTSDITWTPQFDCTKFAFQTNINFSGYNQEDISNLRTFYSNFNFSDNGRFNLPLYELQLAAYDSQGKPTAGHMINIIFVYNTAPDYSSTMRMEPQHDTPNPDIGFEGYLAPFAANSELYLCGSPITSTVPNEIEPVKYITYSVKDKVVTLKEVNPDIELVTQRGK